MQVMQGMTNRSVQIGQFSPTRRLALSLLRGY